MEGVASTGAEADSAPSLLRLVLGLGNPGVEYAATRHNAGFRVVEELASRRGIAFSGEECGALVAGPVAGDPPLLLAKPQTYMNRSGYAARCLVERHAVMPAHVLVIFDDVSLPLGRLRLRGEGGPGGHRGMESVVENLRTPAIARLRLGVLPVTGAPEIGESGEIGDLADFVLAPFSSTELEAAQAMIRRAADAVLCWIERGLDIAMNTYNAG
jgi:PTH1 family peptidyl-tRNA hydrolase